jgi:hypothetical protein
MAITTTAPGAPGRTTAAASVRLARADEFRRYTYGDIFAEPRLILAELGALLPARDAPYDPRP